MNTRVDLITVVILYRQIKQIKGQILSCLKHDFAIRWEQQFEDFSHI